MSGWYASLLIASFLQACGGGGGGHSPSPPTPAPSGLSYPAPPAYTKGTAITALAPTITGTPTAYAVSPALPAGLALDAGSGTISGTPTALQAATNYQVTASNPGGSTSTTLSITVNDSTPDISYAAAAYSLTTGVAVSLTPLQTGGAVVSWTVVPAPPAGVTFDSATGAFGGTPTAIAAASNYAVTAQNSGGSATFNLELGVQSGVLLELGHDSDIYNLILNGSRLVTQDSDHRAILWRTDTRAMLANTNNCSVTCIALAGTTAAFQTTDGFEVFASADGAPLAVIGAPYPGVYWWTLSADGSYLCRGGAEDLKCWSRQGVALFTRTGDYRNAKAFASAGTLRIARGAAGNSVIEKISTPSGASSVTQTFASGFHSWFRDGQRFLGTAGNTVTVYSNEAVQQDIAALPTIENLAAQGNWIWTATQADLKIYPVGASATPSATYPLNGAVVTAGDNTLGIKSGTATTLSIVDLAGPTPVKVDHTVPSIGGTAFSWYTSTSATDWAVAGGWGIAFGERNSIAQQYGLGAVASISATPANIVVQTRAGKLFLFDAQTRALVRELDLQAAKVVLSDDGTRMAAGPSGTLSGPALSGDVSIRIFAVPTFTLIAQWPYGTGGPDAATDFWFSGSGLVIGKIVGPPPGIRDQIVTRVDNTPVLTQPSTGQPLVLSPDGVRIAIASGGPDASAGTDIYVNGVLTTAAAGWPLGWLDDTRLLLNRYHGGQRPGFDDVAIIDSTGAVLDTSPIPELLFMQRVSPTRIYSPEMNTLIDLDTGDTVWSSFSEARRLLGAVAGNYVVFAARGATVRIEPR
jgi:hypothetical protein